jgi:hypothetical protein
MHACLYIALRMSVCMCMCASCARVWLSVCVHIFARVSYIYIHVGMCASGGIDRMCGLCILPAYSYLYGCVCAHILI